MACRWTNNKAAFEWRRRARDLAAVQASFQAAQVIASVRSPRWWKWCRSVSNTSPVTRTPLTRPKYRAFVEKCRRPNRGWVRARA